MGSNKNSPTLHLPNTADFFRVAALEPETPPSRPPACGALRGTSPRPRFVLPAAGLCYNAAIMEYPFRFANNNNNDNNDPQIVGRSLAG
jgi:hypothetical protein